MSALGQADIATSLRHVRFTSESRHRAARPARPFRANRRCAPDHWNTLSECSTIRKIIPKILFLTAASILIGIAYVCECYSSSRATNLAQTTAKLERQTTTWRADLVVNRINHQATMVKKRLKNLVNVARGSESGMLVRVALVVCGLGAGVLRAGCAVAEDSMEQQRKRNMGGIASPRWARVNDQIITEVLSLWLPAIIVGLLILSAFPF